MAHDEADRAEDPRAHWRQLPPEPVTHIEEIHVGPSASDHALPAFDPDQDFIRRYGA
ncbi:hypothetical protein AB0H49_15510 [Nocardia sp. NPDC050713]|uniref:hypothetical protein n=1 Tax=unclassified Nocardia TaxID=2637762 RepID=UPI0033A1142A